MRFSDVVRELDLSQATAHSILKTLCDRGWATRIPFPKSSPWESPWPHRGKTRHYAPAFRPRARGHPSPGHVDRDAGSVVERSGDDLVITAFENPDGFPESILPHERIPPYAPPFGIACAAWDVPSEQDSWVRRGAGGDASLAERLQTVLAQTRERGYDVDWMSPELAQAARAIGRLSGKTVPPRNLRSVIDQLRVEFISANLLPADSPDGAHPVATISAPVLDESDHVRLILAIHPLRTMTMSEIRSAAEPLLIEVTQLSN